MSVRALRRGTMAGRGAAAGGTPPAFQTSAAQIGTTATLSLQIPGGVVVGQIMVAAFVTFTASTHTTPSGWTLIDSTTGSGTYPVRMSTYYRIIQSGDASSSVSFTQSAANHAAVSAGVYDAGTIDVTGISGSPGNEASIVAPSVTATTAVQVVRFFAGMGNNNVPTFAYPATNRRDELQGWLRIGFSDADQLTAGATGTSTTTVTGVTVMWVGATLAIKP